MKKIIDLHQDILLHQRSPLVYKYQNQTSLNQVLASNIQIVFGTGFVFGENDNVFASNCLDLIEEDIDEYVQYEKDNSNLLIIKNREDLEKVDEQSHIVTGLIIHIEGLNTFTDSAEDWAKLDAFYEKGLRSIGIVWTKKNSLGGGDSSEDDSGLSELGKKVLCWAINKKIIIDFSHMNERTFFDSADVLMENGVPIFISHGNARTVCSNKRNYTDQQLGALKKSGGLIGVFFANSCLIDEGLATIEDVVKHIVYIKNLIGIDHLALGTDLGGLTVNIPEGLRDVSCLGNLEKALAKEGFSEGEIEKIFYGNAYNFLKNALS